MKSIKYPNIRKELLKLVEEEQRELTHVFNNSNKSMVNKKLDMAMRNCHKRSDHVIRILKNIKEPTVENIGQDGSGAVCTLVMHSHLSLMKDVLHIYERLLEIDKDQIPLKYIPALVDRIKILETKKQLYGTQWMLDKNDNPFLIEIIDFKSVNKRRREFGLNSIKKPIDLTAGHKKRPIGTGLADISNMKKLTKSEFKSYSKYYLEKIV